MQDKSEFMHTNFAYEWCKREGMIEFFKSIQRKNVDKEG